MQLDADGWQVEQLVDLQIASIMRIHVASWLNCLLIAVAI
jgi:hypothetical protein